jgi:hypothetical protein
MALAIAVFAPVGLAVFDLESPALAAGKGAGNANDRSDNKSDNANKGNKGNSANKSNSGANQSLDTDTELNKGQAKKAEMMAAKATRQSVEEDPSMAPDKLGKLNGVLNASTNALMNASPNSPIGMAGTTLKEALAQAEALNSDGDLNNDVTPEELAAELAGIFDGMTNKTLTDSQVLAVFDRMAELDPTLNRYDLDTPQDPLVAQENADLAQDVADETNSFDLAKAISDMFDDEETDE